MFSKNLILALFAFCAFGGGIVKASEKTENISPEKADALEKIKFCAGTALTAKQYKFSKKEKITGYLDSGALYRPIPEYTTFCNIEIDGTIYELSKKSVDKLYDVLDKGTTSTLETDGKTIKFERKERSGYTAAARKSLSGEYYILVTIQPLPKK